MPIIFSINEGFFIKFIAILESLIFQFVHFITVKTTILLLLTINYQFEFT